MIVDFASDKRSRQLSEAFQRLEPTHTPAPPAVSIHRPNRGGQQGLTEKLDQSWDLIPEFQPEPPPLSVDTGSHTDTPTAPEPMGAQLAGTVFAPAVVAPDSQFLVQVFAHLPEHQEMVAAQAGEFDPDSHRLGTVMFQSKVLAGQRLAFQLVMPGLQIDEPVQTMVWVQSPQSVQFGVTVAPDARTRAVIGTVIVSRDSVPVGELKFTVSVRKSASPAEAAPTAAGDGMCHYRRAFISYCSADRAEVLKRTQMIAKMGVEFFQDILSLESGDFWEPAIYQEIDRCDVFLLFWSKSAKASEWVAKEWRYALNRHGGDKMALPRILPVIIEGPPPEPPPKELEYLHFNDPIMYLVKP